MGGGTEAGAVRGSYSGVSGPFKMTNYDQL